MEHKITNPMFKYAQEYDHDDNATVLVKGTNGQTHSLRLSLLVHADEKFAAFDGGPDGHLMVYPLSSVIRVHVGPESD